MSQKIRCPGCGRLNDVSREECEGCGFPFDDMPAASGAAQDERDTTPPVIKRRPRRKRGMDNTSLTLWLMFAVVAAAALLYLGIRANVERSVPVEGSDPQQQKAADAFRAALDRDSTDIEARIGLANVYYDTGNWPEAARLYTRALEQDSTRIAALVDLGVCYYNLGRTDEAENRFLRAIAMDPHHPIALFNLGIVNERRDRPEEAMRYYRLCQESQPPPDLMQPLNDALARLQQQSQEGG